MNDLDITYNTSIKFKAFSLVVAPSFHLIYFSVSQFLFPTNENPNNYFAIMWGCVSF